MDVAEMEKGILSKLSPTLRGELCYQVFGRILMQAPFLVWARDVPNAFRRLAQRASTNFHAVNDVLIEVEEVNTMIMFLVDGSVTVRTVRPENFDSPPPTSPAKSDISRIYKEAAEPKKTGFQFLDSARASPLADSGPHQRCTPPGERENPRSVFRVLRNAFAGRQENDDGLWLHSAPKTSGYGRTKNTNKNQTAAG